MVTRPWSRDHGSGDLVGHARPRGRTSAAWPLPQSGTKPSFPRPLVCTAGRRIPASSGTNPGARNGLFGPTLRAGNLVGRKDPFVPAAERELRGQSLEPLKLTRWLCGTNPSTFEGKASELRLKASELRGGRKPGRTRGLFHPRGRE